MPSSILLGAAFFFAAMNHSWSLNSGSLTGHRMEKQRLADGRLHGLRQERLGDQIGRLWALARQQFFRIGGDENHGNIERGQNLVDGVDAAAALAQIDV